MPVSFTQTDFRLRNDDGSETTATWKAAANTNVSPDVSVGNVNIRIRLCPQETGTTSATFAANLFASKNSGAYAQVTAATANAKVVDSANITDNEATTKQVVAYTFVAGKMDDVDGTTTATASIAQNSGTEFEFMVQLIAADLANNDTLDFRVYRSGSAIAAYTNTPRLTIVKVNAYIETGSGVFGGVASGADSESVAETGAGVWGEESNGVDTTVWIDVGFSVWGMESTGADIFTPSGGGASYVETGFSVWGMESNSADIQSILETGAAVYDWESAGVDVEAGIDSGSAVVGWQTSGSDVGSGSDTGAGVLGWIAMGTDIQVMLDVGMAEWGMESNADSLFMTATPTLYPVLVRAEGADVAQDDATTRAHGGEVGQQDSTVRQLGRKVR